MTQGRPWSGWPFFYRFHCHVCEASRLVLTVDGGQRWVQRHERLNHAK